MNHFRCAICYLFRKKTKTVLQILVYLLLSVVILTSTMMVSGISNAIQSLSKQLMSSFSIYRDPTNDKLYDYERLEYEIPMSFYVGPRLNETLLNAIIEDKAIEDYNWEKELRFPSVSLLEQTVVPGKHHQYLEEGDVGHGLSITDLKYVQVCPLFDSNTNTNLNRFFKSGQFALVEGRHITYDDQFVTIISDEFAKHNHLVLGDSISIGVTEWDAYFEDFHYYTDDEYNSMRSHIVNGPYELKIVGIYNVMIPWRGQYSDGLDVETWMPENVVFIDQFTGQTMVNARKEVGRESFLDEDQFQEMVFSVKDPALLEDTIERVRSKVSDGGAFKWETDEGTYTASTASLEWLEKVIIISSAGIVLLVMVILVLMNVFMIRTRTQEIAILMSIGIKKRRIISQLILEKIIVVIIALFLSTLPSILLGEIIVKEAMPVAREQVGQEELLMSDFDRYQIKDMFDQRRFFTKYRDFAPEIKTKVTGQTVAVSGFIMIATTIATVLLSCIPIWRMTPKKLMQIRS